MPISLRRFVALLVVPCLLFEPASGEIGARENKGQSAFAAQALAPRAIGAPRYVFGSLQSFIRMTSAAVQRRVAKSSHASDVALEFHKQWHSDTPGGYTVRFGGRTYIFPIRIWEKMAAWSMRSPDFERGGYFLTTPITTPLFYGGIRIVDFIPLDSPAPALWRGRRGLGFLAYHAHPRTSADAAGPSDAELAMAEQTSFVYSVANQSGYLYHKMLGYKAIPTTTRSALMRTTPVPTPLASALGDRLEQAFLPYREEMDRLRTEARMTVRKRVRAEIIAWETLFLRLMEELERDQGQFVTVIYPAPGADYVPAAHRLTTHLHLDSQDFRGELEIMQRTHSDDIDTERAMGLAIIANTWPLPHRGHDIQTVDVVRKPDSWDDLRTEKRGPYVLLLNGFARYATAQERKTVLQHVLNDILRLGDSVVISNSDDIRDFKNSGLLDAMQQAGFSPIRFRGQTVLRAETDHGLSRAELGAGRPGILVPDRLMAWQKVSVPTLAAPLKPGGSWPAAKRWLLATAA